METHARYFPTTDWGLLNNLRQPKTETKNVALDLIARRYWSPVCFFIRQHGFRVDDAEDLAQDFFLDWLTKQKFARAESARGRFRDLVQQSLRRFLSNTVRARQAKRRMPTQGFVSLHQLAEQGVEIAEPSHDETPEAAFNRAWATGLVFRVLRHLEKESSETGKSIHFDIFNQRILRPLLENVQAPSLAELATRHGLDEKQAGNALLTARRAYQRLLRDEIRLYAQSEEEVSTEVRDLFRILENKQAPRLI